MFKTKRDVDRHITHILSRIRDEKEKNSRGFQFAKLYYDVAEYETAKGHLQAFLSVRGTTPQAYKLMGQIWEAQKDKKNALEAYNRCLDLDPEQKEVALKVCELLCDASINVNADIANFCIERAERYYPNNDILFKLKEKVLYANGTGDSRDLEHLIKEGLVKNPADVQFHIRLLRLYMQLRDVKRAYEHALETEHTVALVSSLEWYETLMEVFKLYQDQYGGTDNVTFFSRKLFTMAMFVLLRLQAKECNIHSTVKILSQLDQDLHLAHKIHSDVIEWSGFLAEMKGQLFFLMAVLLLTKALNGQMLWKDASSYGAICFLLSNTVASVDIQSSWYRKAKPDSKRFYDRLYKAGCDRLSQGGHMIYSFLSKQEGDNDWARKLQQKLCTVEGKDKLHIMIFTEESHCRKDFSYFLQSDIFTKINLEVPAKSLLKKYDAVSYSFHCGELNHLVWLAMQYHALQDDIQPDYEHIFGFQLYPEMKYSMSDLSGGDPSTLCQLDIQVFLYACVRWAVLENRERKRNLRTIPDKPDLLPVYLTVPYCNAQQREWWSAVYSMETKTTSEKRDKLWGLVMRGLETIRLVVPDALMLQLIVHIAMTLDARAKEMQSLDAEGIVTPKLCAVLHRAAFYWKAAAEMIDRLERNQSIRMPKEVIFPSGNITTDPALIKSIKDQVKFAMAMVAMRNQNYEEAICEFENLSRPEAAYHTGLIYRKLAEEVCDSNQNSSGSTDYDQQMMLLFKSKTALYKALDRLEIEKNERLKETVQQELAEVLPKLMSLESRGAQTDGMLKPCISQYYAEVSEDESDEEPIKNVPPLKVREMPKISPTRVDVQLKAMEAANSAMLSRVSTLEESVRTIEKMIQEIFSQLRECRDENRSVRDQVQALSLQGLSGINICRPQGMPQPASRVSTMNMSLGGAPMYELPVSQHMSQYGFPSSVGSPHPGSAFGQQNYDDSYAYNNAEYDEPDDNECYIPDQNLVQDWPFGQKTGVEGKSTITYSPQQHARGLNLSNTAVFPNLLRGSSIPYGTGYTPQVPQQLPSAQLPGPGYFSKSSQSIQSGSFQTPIVTPEHTAVATKPTASSPAQVPKVSGSSASNSKSSAPMMPPNAVISDSQSSEAKPMLIPGSAIIPATFSQCQTTSTPSGTQTSEQTPQKIPFNGFSYTSTPKTFEEKPDTRSKEIQPPVTTAAPVSKPFSAFSLTQTQPTAVNMSPQKSQASAGFFLGSSSMSFGSLVSHGQTSPAFQAGDQKSFPGAGAVMFEKSPSPWQPNTLGCSDESIEEYEPNVHFSPLIKLPELIEVKTGEEEEEKLFCERAKLFRFDKETQQWKERGVGELKILKHKISKNVRILMRRDQVLKICANHKLTADMKLTVMSSSDKAWVWTTVDFAEEEMKHEKFAARFKTRDVAEKFKSVFEQCQAELSQCLHEKDTENNDQEKVEQKAAETISSSKCELAQMFKPKPGAWTCDGCYVINEPEILNCVFCGLSQPGVKESNSGFKINTSANSFSMFGTTTTAVLPSVLDTVNSTKASLGFVFAPQTTGTVFGASTTVKHSAAAAFKFGTLSATVGDSSPAGFNFVTSSTTIISSSSLVSSKQSDQETNAAKATPSSEVRPGFGFNVPTVSETKVNEIATTTIFEKGITVQNQDPSIKLTSISTPIQNRDKDTPNKQISKIESDETAKCSNALLAEFLASPDSWKCYACKTSSDGTEVKCIKCGKARCMDKISEPFSAIPATAESSSLFGSKTSMGFAFGSQGVKSLFSLGTVSESKVLEQQLDAKLAPFPFENVLGKDLDRKLHASHISSSLKTAGDGFKFTFAPAMDTEKTQPVATLGSGFNFSINMTPLIKTAKESPSKLSSPNNSYNVSVNSPDGSENSYYENKEGDECNALFEPLIKLPDKVEVKTGEEDEEVLFSHRAKLYRYFKGEWKERGIGDVKVLYHSESNKSRIIMRREHIHKICCNHYIVPELNMQPMPNTKGCALVWFAMDFTDGKPNSENFSIKFKTEENAQMFCSAIKEAKTRLKGGISKSLELSVKSQKVETIGAVSAINKESGKDIQDVVPNIKKVDKSDSDVIFVKVERASDEEVAMARSLMLPDSFYLYTRKPPCPGCRGCTNSKTKYQTYEAQDYEDNNEDDDYDEYTDDEEEEEENDDHKDKLEKNGDQDSATNEFRFDEFSGQSSFASLAASAKTNSFQTDNGQESAANEIIFGGFSGQSSFASLAASANTNAFQKDPSKAPVWPGMGKPLFGGGHAEVHESDQKDDDAQVQQGNDQHFEPVIPLPKLITVVTGEEDETVVFSQRSKLFRFDKDTNQWKEKGVGEMKILKHINNDVYRLLFRREQIHKLVCNHRLTTDINMQPLATSETSWCWTAFDYSENEPKCENLAVRFKNIDQSRTFKDKIDEIQARLRKHD